MSDSKSTIFANLYFAGAKDGLPYLKGSINIDALKEAIAEAEDQQLVIQGENADYLPIVCLMNFSQASDRAKWNNRFYVKVNEPYEEEKNQDAPDDRKKRRRQRAK